MQNYLLSKSKQPNIIENLRNRQQLAKDRERYELEMSQQVPQQEKSFSVKSSLQRSALPASTEPGQLKLSQAPRADSSQMQRVATEQVPSRGQSQQVTPLSLRRNQPRQQAQSSFGERQVLRAPQDECDVLITKQLMRKFLNHCARII